jgi:hypothetical protein
VSWQRSMTAPDGASVGGEPLDRRGLEPPTALVQQSINLCNSGSKQLWVVGGAITLGPPMKGASHPHPPGPGPSPLELVNLLTTPPFVTLLTYPQSVDNFTNAVLELAFTYSPHPQPQFVNLLTTLSLVLGFTTYR